MSGHDELGSRRKFLLLVGGGVVSGCVAWRPQTRKPAIGLQLYTILAETLAAPQATLNRVRGFGVRQVEIIYGPHTSDAFAGALNSAGLQVRSAHVSPYAIVSGTPSLSTDADIIFARTAELGAEWVVCPMPLLPERFRAEATPTGGRAAFTRAYVQMNERDWRDHAAFLNEMAARARTFGLRFAYHNHGTDYLPVNGAPAFHRIAEWTDPTLVDFELDCAWATVAGMAPAAEIRRLGPRCRLLHLKDVVAGPASPLETRTQVPLGQGSVDIADALAAARDVGVPVAFVEQDPPSQTSMLDALELSFAHLQSLGWTSAGPSG
jgi:sugar phosphate isomerase/epimerase